MKSIMKKVSAVFAAVFVSVVLAVAAGAASETENNGTVATPNLINVNETVYAAAKTNVDSGYSQDNDYFKFTLESDGYIQIDFCHEYDSSSQHFYLLTYDGTKEHTQFSFAINSNSEILRTADIGLPAGDYYIEVATYYHDFDYNFIINFTAADNWEKELNDNVVSATQMSINCREYGSTIWDSDEDYYKFTLEQSGYVQIDFIHAYGVTLHNLYIKTYDGTSEKTIASFDISKDSTTDKTDKISLSAGTYYILINSPFDREAEYSFEINYFDSIEPATQQEIPTTHREQVEQSAFIRDDSPTTAYSPAATQKSTTKRAQTTRPVQTKQNANPSTVRYKTAQRNQSSINVYADFQYTVINNEIIITCYEGNQSSVAIPDKIDGIPVCGVAGDAFKTSPATQVKVPGSVYKFAEESFISENGQMSIVGEKDSPVGQYAQSKNLNFDYVYDMTQPAQSQEQESSGKKNTVLIIIIIAVALLAAAAIVIYINSGKPA